MLLTQARSAKAIGGVSMVLGAAVALAPAQTGQLLGAAIRTGQDRYLGRQIGLDLAALGAVLVTAADQSQRASLLNVVVSATALAAVTVAAMRSGDIPKSYATRMLVASGIIGAAAVAPMIGEQLS